MRSERLRGAPEASNGATVVAWEVEVEEDAAVTITVVAPGAALDSTSPADTEAEEMAPKEPPVAPVAAVSGLTEEKEEVTEGTTRGRR